MVDRDKLAWDEFSIRYGQLVRAWGARWSIQPNDIDDLVQETLLSVMSSLPQFRHRGTGSFRAWIKTIAKRNWCDAVGKATKAQNAQLLSQLNSRNEALNDLESELDALARQELLLMAMSRVQQRIEPRTWKAFYRTAIDELSGEAVAEELTMKVSAVYAARCRVQCYITDELAKLARDSGQLE